MFFMTIDEKITNKSRDKIYDALVAEGIQGLGTTFANLHLLPQYQQKIAYGKNGFPWNSDYCKRDISYKKGICPVAENLHDKSYLGIELCLFELLDEEIENIIKAFYKVWSNLDEL